MRWFRSLWALVIMLAVYLVPVAFHFDAVAALAGRYGAWAFVGLYFLWGLLFGVITAKRESAATFLLTIWPGLLLLVTSIGFWVAESFVALVIYAILYVPAIAIVGGAVARDLLDIAARRFEAQHLSATQRLGFVLVFSVSLLPLAILLNAQYPDLFVGRDPTDAITWWLLYADLLLDALSLGLLGAVGARLSGIQASGILDGGLWWLSRTLLDVILIAAVLDRLRSGKQRLGGALLEL